MNNLINVCTVDDLLCNKFRTVIVTDIILANNEAAQMVTLLSHIGMFDETVMGINKALRSGGRAAKWQSRVYSFIDGRLTDPITYKPVIK